MAVALAMLRVYLVLFVVAASLGEGMLKLMTENFTKRVDFLLKKTSHLHILIILRQAFTEDA